jgi:hypothetical protein
MLMLKAKVGRAFSLRHWARLSSPLPHPHPQLVPRSEAKLNFVLYQFLTVLSRGPARIIYPFLEQCYCRGKHINKVAKPLLYLNGIALHVSVLNCSP